MGVACMDNAMEVWCGDIIVQTSDLGITHLSFFTLFQLIVESRYLTLGMITLSEENREWV